MYAKSNCDGRIFPPDETIIFPINLNKDYTTLSKTEVHSL